MSFKQTLASLVVSGLSVVGIANRSNAELYDDFSSGTLNSAKWEVRQDTEGQPLMDEGFVANENGNYVFHTRQNTDGDRRTYLFPKHEFKAGESIEYDVNVVSTEGTHASMALLTGSQYARLGAVVPDLYNDLGTSHISLSFFPDRLNLTRVSPSNELFSQDLSLNDSNGTYELYLGSFTDGRAHIDYDNFNITPEPGTMVILGLGALALRRRNGKTNK